ncbi:MAG: VWA domain-containing protein [Polyangia bacterium]
MSLADPKLLWCAVVVPLLVVAYALDGQRRKRVLERIGHLATIRQMMLTLSTAKRRLQIICLIVAVAALTVGIARPQVAGRARLTESRGLDLVIALDLSRSMLAKDIYPSRLERAKAEVSRLLDELHGDRVGMVAFAGETLAYPLTSDYEAAKLFWRDLQPSDMPVGGTDLGRAISASQELLDRSAARAPAGKRKPGQVILLITDGEDTEGRGLQAAKAAAAHHIRIYTVAIGSKERPFVPLTDEDGKSAGYLAGADGEPVRVGLDEEGLRKIASVTGGDYFTMEPRGFGVERVQKAIAGLERTEEEARLEREPEDIGRWFVLGGFVLLVIGTALRDRRSPAVVAKAVSARATLLVLLCLFPFLGGWDLFTRKDPDIEAGNRAMEAGRADDALKAYDRAVAARPEDDTAHYDRASALLKLDKLPEATRELQRAVETHDPSLKADSYYNLGVAQHRQEHYREAVDAYKRALGLRPDDRRTKWNLEVAQRMLAEQKKQQDQKQSQDQKQDPKQDQKQQDQKQDQKQQDQKQDQQQQQQAQDQKQDQKQDQQQQQAQDEKQDQKQGQQQQQAGDQQKPPPDPRQQAAMAHPDDKATDKQDAEAVLDSLERSEPTVQKDLARRRAGDRKPKKDW